MGKVFKKYSLAGKVYDKFDGDDDKSKDRANALAAQNAKLKASADATATSLAAAESANGTVGEDANTSYQIKKKQALASTANQLGVI